MSWLLKSKRLQSAGHGASNVTNNGNNSNNASSISNGNSIYSQASNNLSSSSLSSSTGLGYGSSTNLSSVSLTLNNNGSSSASSAQLLSSHHHIDAGEDMVRQFAASQLDTQKTAFMRWVNVQLAATPNYVPMTSIERDLRDGKRLIALLEVVSKEPLKPERGNMRIHQMANVSKALAFLEKRTDDPLGSIGNEDIVNGNLKLTLGLLWMVIYRFQIQQIANTMAELFPSLSVDDMMEGDDSTKSKKKGTSQQVDAKQALLRWVRYQLEDYSDVIPLIQDFHRSWRTGLAFAALIHRHDPAFLPEFYGDVLQLPFETSDDWRRTLTRAFEVALEKMCLPRLLDPEDLLNVETPDERSIMTYISEYYIIMSKHQMEQDPQEAAEMHRQRLQAKDERLALAGEDQQARQLRLKEEEERRRRGEQEETERIRLRRMEIEGWSIRAAERAKEEEEALRKRREEDEERRLQRKLRREQRQKEKTLLNQKMSGGQSRKNAEASVADSVFSESDHECSDSDTELIDPKEQERRQLELEEKLEEYHQRTAELTEWVREQDMAFPPTPDTASLLDRTRDLEPLAEIIKTVEEEQAVKEHIMSHLHDVREELLEYENPDLTPEQVSDLDRRWWELETLWNTLSNKVMEAKDTAEEVKWIIDCSQEIDRVNGEISKFEAQLVAFAEKRSQETPQDRSQKPILEQQDVSLSSISFLLKTYVDFLTSLMDPKVHHYTAPEHLTALNNELTTVRLPRLGVVIEKAQQNLSNDRLLRSFLDSFVLSEAWIGESVEWLANIEVPIFVTEDHWSGASTVNEYLARDASQDLDLEYYQAEIDELKGELGEEQSEVTTFRLSGFAKLDEQAKAVLKGVTDTQDVTAEVTTRTVQDLMQGVMSNLEKVEKLLPKEAEHYTYTARVLDYLWEAQTVLMELEQASTVINRWEMRQPDSEVEVHVFQVEEHFGSIDTSLRTEQTEPTVREVVQSRHAGLTSVVKNLRVCFQEKQGAIKGDRQMKEFLELTLTYQAALRDFRSKLHDGAPMTGFGLEDPTPFDDFAALVHMVGESFDEFECGVITSYLEMGSRVKVMAEKSCARQDPAIVQSKLQSVNEALDDIKTLRADRERNVVTIAECRQLVVSLSTLRSDLCTLEADLSELEHLEPSQHTDLIELGHRTNHLGSQYAIFEQDSVFCHLSQDPSCSKLLQDITERQTSIQHTHERLQAKLELKQQWDMAWESFEERSNALQQYLEDMGKTILERGFVSLDCLTEDEPVWRKSEDAVRDAELANDETHSRLNDFKALRLLELSTLAGSLRQVTELAGGLDRMDDVRAGQFRESEEAQQNLQDHLQRLHALNSQERHQLDTLRQRLLWSQHLADSKADIDVLSTSCQDAISGFTEVLKSCEQTGDTSDIDRAAGEHLDQQIQHLSSLASNEKNSRFETALSTYSKLKELALSGSMLEESHTGQEKTIPAHLESELATFKSQYDILDHQLICAGQLAKHAMQIASYLERNNALDIQLGAVAADLKVEKEATVKDIEAAAAARVEFKNLSEELHRIVSSVPLPSDDTQPAFSQIRNEYQANLEVLLTKRLEITAEMSEALDPLLASYESLLRYQDDLRSLVKDLEAHSQWLDPSNEKIQQASDRIRALFSSWPGEEVSLDSSRKPDIKALESQLDDVHNLKSELTLELAHVESKEREFEAIKHEIAQALKAATSHSKHLQRSLERSLESIESKIQELKAEVRHKSYQLECLEKQSAWEQGLQQAQEWCSEFDNAVIDFVGDHAQWRSTESDSSTGSADLGRSDIEQQMQLLDSSLAQLETQLKTFEDQEKPKVQQAWTDLCGALVFIDRSIPADFEDRQSELARGCQTLRARIAYAADVVKQRKALEGMSMLINELERLRSQLESVAGHEKPDENAQAFGELEARIRSLAKELEVDFKSLHYPSDDSSDETRAKSQNFNAHVRGQVQDYCAIVEAAKKTLDEAILSREVLRRKLELQAIQQNQNQEIDGKASNLEKVSGLLDWVDETAQTVSNFARQESKELGSEATAKGDSIASLSTLSKDLPSVTELSSLSKESLKALSARLETLRQEIKDMTKHKKDVEAEIMSTNLDDQVASLSVSANDESDSNTVSKDSAGSHVALHGLEDAIEQNRSRIAQLDRDITSKLSEFDIKAASMLDSLNQQSDSLALALKERLRIDEELAREQELERLRIQRAMQVQQFKESKDKFMSWSEAQLQELGQLWDTYGYFVKNEEAAALYGNESGPVNSTIAFLEADTLRCNTELSKHENAYFELKSRLDALYSGEEHEADRQRHAEAIDAIWSTLNGESIGYREILNQMRRWSDLRDALGRFEKEGLDTLEKRVESLRWMHWDAFQPEEDSLLKLVEDVESQASDLQARADLISTIELSPDVQASHQAILNANKAYFDERLESIPTRIEAAKTHIEIIHDTSKEIALHAKFHADLVRVETAIAQQIDAVKARLGSLERSSCFALNSKALEAVVVAANEICMDGKYQFSVLQEVEYSGLEQTAFDLDMLTAEDPSDPEANISSVGVQESMQRIRQALKQLESYIEEDCFETLLAAKFYTHCKATEDIRQWITACRDSMGQLCPSDKNLGLTEKVRLQQTKEWKTRHLETLEKRLSTFGATVQNYDGLSSDFMLLHHPQSSSLDLSDQAAGTQDDVPPVSMRVILRQTVQERAKRTREDWELLKQEFLAKTSALDELGSDDDNGSVVSDLNGSGLGHVRRGSEGNPTVKARMLSRFGTEILEDISRISREMQEMFGHVSSTQSTLSLAVESDGALIKSKDGQARLEMIEGYIRDVLQAKVEKFDAMLSAANEQNEQDQARIDDASEQDLDTRNHMRHHEKMVGVAMQRGLIAESMNRLVESCHHHRKEVDETVRVQNAMDLIHEIDMLCDSMATALASADSLLVPAEVTPSTSLYNLPSASSSTSLVSINSSHTRLPNASPSMSPSTVSRATVASRERRASRASMRRSFSLSSMGEEDVQQWESNYRSLMGQLDRYTHDIEQRLDTVSSMADRLNDWRLDESYGVATERWQKLKRSAFAKKQELDRIWTRRSEGEGSKVHPLEGPSFSSRPSLMQATASSNSRAKAILGSPVESSPVQQRKKHVSAGNIMARGTLVPPSPTPSTSGTAGRSSRATVGRIRSGTMPAFASSANTSQNDLTAKKLPIVASPNLHAMSPTYSQEAKRRAPIIRKNDSTSSISSLVHTRELTSPPARQQQRTLYKPDMSNMLDVEVARVVNASGFSMKVQKLKEGQSPYLSPGGRNRSRSDSTSSLVHGGLSDNGGYEGGMDSTNSSPRAVKTIRGQAQLNVQSKSSPEGGASSGEVGRYMFGDVEPKVCYCRILRSRKVMVRVGGGWSELSKFMEDHASLEQRMAKSRLLSASNSSVSVASHFGGSTSVLSGTESRQRNLLSPLGGSSDSLSDSHMSGSGSGEVEHGEKKTPNMRKKKEMVLHIRPSDDMSIRTIKLVKNAI